MSVADKVAAMAQGFLARLPARLDSMQAAFAQCTAQADSAPHWTELHRLLHSLNGAAGTFGFEALGSEAAAIEKTIKDMLAQGAWQDADLAAVGAALRAMQARYIK